jgi:hypothetical protein
VCRPSRSLIIQKFFGSFFQKRTERKRFFFEKKKQKTFFNLASVWRRQKCWDTEKIAANAGAT